LRIPWPEIPNSERHRAEATASPSRLQMHMIVSEKDLIAQFIARHGVVRCPPAYCAPSIQGERPDRRNVFPPLVRRQKDKFVGSLYAKLRREPA
jgi:hypothetical protein